MASDSSPADFRLHSVDRHGRTIDPAVLAAAQSVVPRALKHATNLLGDSAAVANALEEVAAQVSRVVEAKATGDAAPIRNLAGYVFRAFVRHVNRLKRGGPVLLNPDGLTPRWADPSGQIETKILVDECLTHFDFVTRDMFWRRLQGFTWEDIGKVHGLSGHAAEVRFNNAARRVKARLADGRRSVPSAPRAGRSQGAKPAMKSNAQKKAKRA